MADNDFIWRFTPSRTEPHVLEEIFVQRESLLTDILERISESALTGNKHQILLIGPRGIGKTHLIALLHHRVTQDPVLSDKVRIAWLLEDETITSFVQLVKRFYELLAEEYPSEFPRDWLEGLLDLPPARILKALETALVDKFRDKMLLLFVENLDLIFEGLGDAGQKEWRAFLQTHPFTSVVATSQRLFKSIQSREQPFFGFFTATHLRPLHAADAVELLRRIARHREQAGLVEFLATPEGRSRVRALHHLAGGNHRIYVVMSGFITRESLDDLAGPFEKMADEMTPYYQERMRWLSAQQRQIVEYLCSREDTCTPKEIARHLLAAENTVSSQLNKLLKLGYVLRSPRGRESLYELAEPLMRLASEVKDKRRKPLRLLVNFLRIWYRPDVLPKLLAKASTPSLRAHLRAAIRQSQSSPDPRLRVVGAEIAKARQENRLEDLLKFLEEQAHTRGSTMDWFDLAYCHDDLQNFEAAVECCDKSWESDPRNADALTLKGYVLGELGRHEAAVECFDQALDIDPQDSYAWMRRGDSLDDLGRYEAAIESFDKSLGIDPRNTAALTLKGFTLIRLGQHEAALECYDKSLEINPQDSYAWMRKGDTLDDLGRYEAALHCYEQVLQFDSAEQGRGFYHCEAMFALRRWQSGFESLAEAFRRSPRDTNHGVKNFIDLVMKLSEGYEELQQHVSRLIAIYHEAGVLEYLGSGLLRSLRRIDVGRIGVETLENWRDAWLKLGGGYPVLEIPLRIFRVGIEYVLQGDEKVLLDLVTTERTILRQSLALEMRDDVE